MDTGHLSSTLLNALLLRAAVAVNGAVREISPPISPDPELAGLRGGLFVTLLRRGELAGCLGVVRAESDLAASADRLGAAVALEDLRFDPIAPEDLGALDVEVSVLSETAPTTVEDFELGVHGLVLQLGNAQSVLLPQVAIDHGLDRRQFLGVLSEKAGLETEGWRHADLRLEAFTVQRVSAAFRELLPRSAELP